MASDTPRCFNCRFFRPNLCRRHAPIGIDPRERWPFVISEDWCGDHELIPSLFDDAEETGGQ